MRAKNFVDFGTLERDLENPTAASVGLANLSIPRDFPIGPKISDGDHLDDRPSLVHRSVIVCAHSIIIFQRKTSSFIFAH